jgi:ceramide glucosyltransferase
MWINLGIVGLALVFGLIPLIFTWRCARQIRRASKILYPRPRARVGLILPCKGIDPGFRENIRSFFQQDYTNMEIVFSVATEDDPACPEIDALIYEMAERIPARRIVAGISTLRAQKITNLLKAVETLGDSVDILFFADSDLRPDAGFIRRLITPLSLHKVGATTGYRWYAPPTGAWGSVLRSTWNAGALPFVADPKRNFCFGGAMALRREIFEDARLAHVWDRTLSDDLTLTVAVRRLGLEIRFVPSCVAISYESSTLAQTIEFTNRQSLISRVYFPPLWWGAAIGHSLGSFLILYGLANVGLLALKGGFVFAIGSACLLMVPLQWINGLWLLRESKLILPTMSEDLHRLRWRYMFSASLAPFLSLLNTINSLLTNRITWRGIQYELRSTTETIVFKKSVQSTKDPKNAATVRR